jgi:hypothetical protein
VKNPLSVVLALVVLAWGGAASAEAPRSAKVSFLEGKAWRVTSAGTKAPLAKDGEVFENDTVETEPVTRVELRTQDGSAVRVGPSSKLVLKAAYFGPAGEKKFSAKLFFGQVWTKVSGVMGGNSKFEVETDNAVAGVRGTTFRIDAKSDKSVVMKVYAGAVAMASSGLVQKKADAPKTGRKQIGGPVQVSAGEWEKLVGAMMQISVNADGTAGDPVAFKAGDDAGDDWASWNQKLDEAGGK